MSKQGKRATVRKQGKTNQPPVNGAANHLEETAAEFMEASKVREEVIYEEEHHVFGWISIALALISFFFLPIVFALSGIIIGWHAQKRQSKILGYSGLILSLVSIIRQLLLFW